MKRIVNAFLISLAVFFFYGCDIEPVEQVADENAADEQGPVESSTDLLQGVQRFKQSTIRIERDMTLYFDPYQFNAEPHDADIIFITHSHSDHFSADDIAKVGNDSTLIVAPKSMEQAVSDLGFDTVETVEPGKEYSINGLKIEATFAYNDAGFKLHGKNSNWVGYVVTIDGARYYICGDTNFVPELQNLRADVAFLNVGGGTSMNAVEAAEAAASIKPKIAIPIHYGATAGSAENARNFLDLLDESIQGQMYSDNGERI